MLDTLPIEIALAIVAHLTLREIHAFQLVHPSWTAIVRSNENTVYLNVALLHGFVNVGDTLDDAHWDLREDGTDSLGSWKELCQRRLRLERNWEGRGHTPSYRFYENTLNDVHRFKLDERPGARLVISTHRNGGLRLTDMDDGEAIWELPSTYVRPYAHCEYDQNYLIFDRSHPHALEVWRLRSDADPSFSSNFSNAGNPGRTSADRNSDEDDAVFDFHPNVGKEFGPNASQFAVATDPPAGDARAEFIPWALFEPEFSPRAYRFVYPTLLTASEFGQCVYLFDAPSASVIETIPIPPPDEQILEETPAFHDGAPGHVHINYVELSPRHAFVCTPSSIIILPRTVFPTDSSSQAHQRQANGNAVRQVLRFPHADPALRNPQLVKHYAAKLVQALGPAQNAAMQEFAITAPREPESSTALVRMGMNGQIYTAVHVSPSGRDFVGATALGVLYIVKDFERVARGEASFSDLTLRIDLGTGAHNLAYEHDRLLVQTQHAIFIINLHSTSEPFFTRRKHYNINPPQPSIFPNLTAYKLLDFTRALPLRLTSCIKLTRTSAWLDWSTLALEEVERQRSPRSANPEDEEQPAPGLGGFFANQNDDEMIPEAIEEDHPAAKRAVTRIGFLPGETPMFGELAGYLGGQSL